MSPCILCDRQPGGPACDYRQQERCNHTPLNYKDYCSYELDFIEKRYDDLKVVYENLRRYYKKSLGITEFKVNYAILWEICFIYANDLKLIRQFHDIQGGCDKSRRGALLARLVSKHHPIHFNDFSIPDNPQKQRDELLRINEHFAFHVLHHYLDTPEGVFTLQGMERVSADLLFIFGHRDPQIESLVSIARLIKRVSEQYIALGQAAVLEAKSRDKVLALEKRIAEAKRQISILDREINKRIKRQ